MKFLLPQVQFIIAYVFSFVLFYHQTEKKIWLFQFTCNRHCSSLTSTLPRLRRDTSVIITKRMVIGNDNQMDISAWMHCHYIVMDRMSDRHINISISIIYIFLFLLLFDVHIYHLKIFILYCVRFEKCSYICLCVCVFLANRKKTTTFSIIFTLMTHLHKAFVSTMKPAKTSKDLGQAR